MTTFYLIRHATNDLVGNSIAGRKPGVHLSCAGREEAERLALQLAHTGITQIYTSPLERTRETAEALARKLQLPIHDSEAFKEIDFGDWTGRSFSELEPSPAWRQWNQYRSGSRVPNGEMILEVQSRMVREIERLRREFPEDSIAIVSHGDPLKSVLFYYLGMSVEMFQRLEISPASYSILVLEDWSAQVKCVNVGQ
jgi:broad specificity phosphatase PhoE